MWGAHPSKQAAVLLPLTVYKFQAAIVASACHSHWWGEGGSSEGCATVELAKLLKAAL